MLLILVINTVCLFVCLSVCLCLRLFLIAQEEPIFIVVSKMRYNFCAKDNIFVIEESTLCYN